MACWWSSSSISATVSMRDDSSRPSSCAVASGEEVSYGRRRCGVAQLRQAPGVLDGAQQRVVVVGGGGAVPLLHAGTRCDHRDLPAAVEVARPLVPDQEEGAVGPEGAEKLRPDAGGVRVAGGDRTVVHVVAEVRCQPGEGRECPGGD